MKKILKVIGISFLSLVGLVVLVWCGLAAYFLLRAHDITPSDDSDIRLAEPVIPNSENGYVAFLAVTNLYALSNEDATACTDYRTWRRSGKLSRYQEALTNEWQVTVDRVLTDHAPYFAGLHEAAACPRYGFVRDGGAWEWLAMPPVTAMMRANTLWTTKAMRETERRDYAAALATVRDHLAFGRMIGDNPSTVIEMLVGNGIRASAESEVVALAAREDLPDAIMAELAALVRDEPDAVAAFGRAVRCEYGRGVDKLCEMIRTEPFGARRGPLVAERCFAWMPGFVRFSIQPGATKQAYADAVRAMLRGIPSDRVVPEGKNPFKPNWAGRRMVRTITVGIHSQHESLKNTVLHTRFAQLVVAAQRYRRAHGGAYPPTLDALVPAYLAAAPHDPFAPKAALRYDAAKGVAWSVGANGGFSPFPEKTPHMAARFECNLDKYAVRLDGKPHKRVQERKKLL